MSIRLDNIKLRVAGRGSGGRMEYDVERVREPWWTSQQLRSIHHQSYKPSMVPLVLLHNPPCGSVS